MGLRNIPLRFQMPVRTAEGGRGCTACGGDVSGRRSDMWNP